LAFYPYPRLIGSFGWGGRVCKNKGRCWGPCRGAVGPAGHNLPAGEALPAGAALRCMAAALPGGLFSHASPHATPAGNLLLRGIGSRFLSHCLQNRRRMILFAPMGTIPCIPQPFPCRAGISGWAGSRSAPWAPGDTGRASPGDSPCRPNLRLQVSWLPAGASAKKPPDSLTYSP